MKFSRKTSGFTLIEILVVISIIAVLSTISVISVNSARAAAKIAKAREDLYQIRNGIALLQADTGKWPNGCPTEGTADPEVDLNSAQAGLLSRPTAHDQGSGCVWTAADVAAWHGPYASFRKDPWGVDYWFDPDYTPYSYSGCALPDEALTVVVVSFGPNKTGLNVYDCDDIFLRLR